MNMHVHAQMKGEAYVQHVRELVTSIIKFDCGKEETERQIKTLFSSCGYIEGSFEVDLVYERYVRVSFTGSIGGTRIAFSTF